MSSDYIMDICRNSKGKSWEKTLKREEKVNGGRAKEMSRIGKKETSEGGEKQENATPNYLRSTNSAKMFNNRIKKRIKTVSNNRGKPRTPQFGHD